MQALSEASIFELGFRNTSMDQSKGGTIPMAAGNAILFEKVFKEHFKGLHSYAFTMTRDEQAAEDIVQNMFLKLWEKKDEIQIERSLASYLYRAVYNDCLNHLKHQKVRAAHRAHEARNAAAGNNSAEQVSYKELERKLELALNVLPEGCRTVFQMSRFEELKYHEIATKLDISVKTVENQMGKALRLLRQELTDFLPAILITILLNL
jgi:RNA polymerase sigma-70 factor (ECF subfamily)